MITGKWKVVDVTLEQEFGGTDELHVHIMTDAPWRYGNLDDIKKVVEVRMNPLMDYMRNDIEMSPTIKDVIFNDPATIVFWADGTKTVVKCQEGDEFDPEKGLTMAIAKKVYGNKGHYFETVKKWCEPYYERRANIQPWLDAIKDALNQLSKVRDV